MSDNTDRLYGAALIVDEKLRIIKDRYGLYEELKTKHDLLRAECDAAAKAIDAMDMMHEELGREYRGALAAIDALSAQLKLSHDVYSQTINDLEVQLRFWRQAAEHAVNGWNALEDKHESLLDVIKNLLGGDNATRAAAWQTLETRVDDREEWAAPVSSEVREIVLPDDANNFLIGCKIVETEKPR